MVSAKQRPSKPRPSGGKKRAPMTPEEEPIIITGGSVILEYPDTVNNKFDDDGSMPGRKKKLKNRTRGSDRVYLTFVDITDKNDNVLMTIDLNTLGVNKKCKVKVYYSASV
jgi:hypothetical protein